MVLYDRFYKKVGIRKSGHFTSPLIIEASTLQYPKNSDIYYFKVSDVVEKLSSDIPLLNKPNQIFVKSKFYYSEEANAGKFVKVPFVLNTRLDEIKGKEKKMMFLRPNVKRTITNRAIVLYNYSSMGASYRYIGVNFTKLYKFNNILTTVVEDLAQSTEPRHKFLIIDLPDTLPKLQKLNLFATSLNISRLKSITTYKYFTLLELWKLIHPNMREKSIFNRIPEKEWENITLLFTLNNKVAVFNMALFKLLIKEYNKEEVSQESLLDSTNGDFFEALLNEYDLSIESLGLEDNVNLVTKVSYKSTLFRRMFYVFLFKVITQKKSLPVEEIEELLSKGITGLSPDSKEKKSLEIETEKVKHSDTEEKLEKVLDSIIDQDVPISNVKDDNPDSLLGDNVEEVERTTEEQENAEIYEEEDNSIESKILLDTNNTVQNTYGSLDLILKEKPKDPEEDLLKNVSLLKDYGTLSKLEEKKIRNILLDQKERKSPYKETPEKLSEILYNIKPEEKQIENPDVNDNNVIFDKSYNKNTTKNFDRAYIEKSLKKDTIRTVYALQNFNNIIEDYQIESTSSILDTQETHIIKMRTLTGSPSKIKIHLPKIEEDGTFRMSGNKYLIRKQRTETPIKKINGTTVVLNSYYGKVFIHKALQKRDDFGYWFSRQLFKLYEGEVIKDLIEGTVKVIDRDLPVLYSQIARYTLGFTIGKYNFNFKYKDRETLVGKKDIEKIEQKEFVVCGTIGKNEVILMDKKNQLTSYHLETGIVNHLPKMEEILKLDLSQAPVEYSTIKIGKHHIPLVLLLSYYIGLENLLKVLKVDYYFTETNKRLEDKQYTYRFKFKDGYLTCKQDQGLADMIIYGLDRIKTLDQVNFKAFQDRATFNSVFSYLEINVNVITEIKMLEKLFVDPMTRVLLEQLGEPETFKGLLFRASELLLDDNAKHPNNMSEQVVKGYERLNGILYKSLITAVKEHENRANFSKSKVEVDPFVVMKKIKDDSSTVLIDDLNPLAMIKQTEDVTYLGEFGRQEITMTKETRVIHPTEIGVISEAAKDNGSVGITAYLSSNPALNSLTGTVGAEENKTLEWGDILSTSALLSPFSTTDDSKRFKI